MQAQVQQDGIVHQHELQIQQLQDALITLAMQVTDLQADVRECMCSVTSGKLCAIKDNGSESHEECDPGADVAGGLRADERFYILKTDTENDPDAEKVGEKSMMQKLSAVKNLIPGQSAK